MNSGSGLPDYPQSQIFKLKGIGLGAIAGIGLLLLVFTFMKIREGLYFDDTFMFVRYAHNIIKYGNYGWNAQEHTYGCTNIPFTFYIALLKVFHIDQLFGLSATLLLSSFFWAVLSLVFLYKIIVSLAGDFIGSTRWPIILFLCTIAIAPVFSYNIITGMDTTFSLFFNVLMIHFLFRYISKPGIISILPAAWFAYFIFLLRPDCGIYSVLLPILLFTDAKLPVKKILFFYVLLFGFFGADTLIKYFYFGNPLPLPFFIKKSGFYLGYLGKSTWNAVQYSFDFFIDFGFLFFAFLLFCTGQAIKKFLVFGIPVLLTLLYFFTVNQIMGFHSRYYLPSMPFWIIGTIYGFREIRNLRITPYRLVWPALYVIFLLFLQFASPVYELYVQRKSVAEAARFSLPPTVTNRMACRTMDYKEGIQAMQDLISLLPADATIAATEYGYLSVKAPDNKFMDLCGLHNYEFALHGYSDHMLGAWSPTLIWLPANEYTALRKQIISGDYFKKYYDFFPDAMSYGIAILKNSPYHDKLVRRMTALDCQ